MEALELFKYEGNDVRSMTKEDGSIWFVARDI